MAKRLTQEEFLKKAKAVHGSDVYDYSHAEYIDAKTKVKIYCKIHAEYFEIIPDSLCRGSGCRKCSVERRSEKRRMTLDEFIMRGKSVHGDQFDYSRVEYKNANVKVTLYCRKHDFWFSTLPYNHLSGKGCAKCRGDKISAKKFKTQGEFISRSIAAHGERYDYSGAVYEGMDKYVTIICPSHGPWAQIAKNHCLGHGCPKCGFEEGSGKNRKTMDEFLSQAMKVHISNNYDYSEAEYVNSATPVTIICHKHNDGPFRFRQTPNSHLGGSRCPKCAGTYMCTTEEYVKEIREIFGELYDYSRVEYTGRFGNVWLKCKEHGWFEKISRDVLRGIGCPMCAEYGFNKSKPAILYYLKIDHADGIFYKIGITNRTVEARFGVNDLKMIEVARTWFFESGGDAYITEKMILDECREDLAGIGGILESGNTEIFNKDIFE